QNGEMKFYLTIPQKWAKNFISSIKQDWGQVDITKVKEDIINFDYKKAKAIDIHMRHHYALAVNHKQNNDSLYSSIASLASTLGEDDKLLIDYNISPIGNSWKEKAMNKI